MISQGEAIFVTNATGKIHLSSCRYVAQGHMQPWLWAQGKSETEIRVACVQTGRKFCRSCLKGWP